MPLRNRAEQCLWFLRQRKVSFVAYVHAMRSAFSTKFILLMFLIQCFLNGIIYMTVVDSMFPLFKSLGMEPSRLQIMVTLAMAPWSLKPLTGIMSDSIALGRYHKRYWMILSCAVGLVGASVLVTGTRNVTVLVLMFFCLNYQVSCCDLLVEGKYAELMNKNPDTGSNIVTLKSGMQQLGFIAAMGYVGPLADANNFTTMYVVCLCFCVTPIIPLLLGWLPEEKIPVWSTLQRLIYVDVEKVRTQWRMILFIAFIGLSGPGVSIWMAFSPLENVTLSRIIGLSVGGLILLIGIIGGYCGFPRIVGHVVLYQIVTSLARVDVGTALDFFYTASEECLPGGPHFSMTYYIMLGGILGTVMSFLFVFVYQILFSRWKFRNVLLFTTLLGGVAGVFDVAMVKRWNLIIGIPDKAFYVIGEAILERGIGMLMWIPSSALIGKACPPGMEAATYAYLAGMSNFAGTVSSLSGAMAIDLAGLKMNPPLEGLGNMTQALGQGYECNWDNLWLLVLIGHIIAPVVTGCLVVFVIPNVYQTDTLVIEQPKKEEDSKTLFTDFSGAATDEDEYMEDI